MKNIPKILVLLSIVLPFVGVSNVSAEPWLSNRFAQNCAGCHSPSRRNRPLMDRRCTLTCQGCHVNPSGGGLRSSYGNWNSQRWLKSFAISKFNHKMPPAPLERQEYHAMSSGSEKKVEKRVKKSKRSKKRKRRSKRYRKKRRPNSVNAKMKKMPEGGFPLVERKDLKYDYRNWSEYDRSDKEEHIIETDKNRFLYRLTKEDPYRRERRETLLAGIDVRYIFQNILSDVPAGFDKTRLWGMSTDIGLRARPFTKKVSFVIESRFLNGPGFENLLQDPFIRESRLRSAYILVDDLPFNAYIQHGFHRPLFGLYDPDHTSLSSTTTGLGNRAVFRTTSIGAAPNVPFINFHLLHPAKSITFSQEKGFVVNAGARAVSFGGSATVSYWTSTRPSNLADLTSQRAKTDLIAVTLGGTLFDIVGNFEFLRAKKQRTTDFGFDAGTVMTFQFKRRMWREIYFTTHYSMANLDPRSMEAGSASEYKFGFKAFLIPGVEADLLYTHQGFTNEGTSPGDTTTNAVHLLAHLFY